MRFSFRCLVEAIREMSTGVDFIESMFLFLAEAVGEMSTKVDFMINMHFELRL